MPVVIVDEFLDQMVQVLFAENDEVAQAFDLERLHEAFAMSIQVGASDGQSDNGRALGFYDGVESFGEFGVTIANQVSDLKFMLI